MKFKIDSVVCPALDSKILNIRFVVEKNWMMV